MPDGSRFELGVLHRVDGRVDERVDLEPQLARIQLGAITLDDATLLQIAHATLSASSA